MALEVVADTDDLFRFLFAGADQFELGDSRLPAKTMGQKEDSRLLLPLGDSKLLATPRSPDSDAYLPLRHCGTQECFDGRAHQACCE